MEHRHFMLYKPYGYLSQFIDNSHRQKHLLGDLYPFPSGTMAVGRLDKTSEGLLLLTTDGKFSEHMRSKLIEKEYYLLVDGLIDDFAIEKLMSGVEIGVEGQKYLTQAKNARILSEDPALPHRKVRDNRHGPTRWLSLTLCEGKFRQVRKMTAAVGFPTLRLVRVRIGSFLLHDIQPGEVFEIKPEPYLK